MGGALDGFGMDRLGWLRLAWPLFWGFAMVRFASLAFVAFACQAAVAEAASRPPQTVTVRFAASVAGTPFACGRSYTGLGRDKVSWTPQDLRFYVSDVALLRPDGTAVPVTLTSDGTWQNSQVALLDFEDGTGGCKNGTRGTNEVVRGTVPAGTADTTGLRFTLAVPFAANHDDASTQEPPLDQAGLFWGWQMGYKFLSLEGRVNDTAAYVVHFGSTGCAMDGPNKVTGCAKRNEATVTLAGFNPRSATVVLDVAQVLADTTLMPAAKASGPARIGCMSEHDNPACAPIFARFGLSQATGSPAGAQQVFGVR